MALLYYGSKSIEIYWGLPSDVSRIVTDSDVPSEASHAIPITSERASVATLLVVIKAGV